MFTDCQGSVTDIYSEDGDCLFHAEYDPWGNMTARKNEIAFRRGYTGHEMLPEFGLVNMNGRMYDPRVGRFLSPDPYVQMPDNGQNFNRYSYCLNNPLKYTDPSGNIIGFDDIAAFLIGGTINLTCSLISGEVHSFWHGAELFVVGGVSGLATMYGSPLAGAAVIGAGNSIVNQGNTKGWGNISLTEVLTSTMMSTFASIGGEFISPYTSKITSQFLPNFSNPLLESTLDQGVANSLSGFTIGTAMSLGTGSDLKDALKNGGKDAALGLASGTISGATNYYMYARENKLSPWTGEKTNRHHSFPKFLGGATDQELTTMSVSRHKQFHKDFNEYLYQQRNEKGEHMRPQRGNSGMIIRENFKFSVRFDTTRHFYDSHPLKYWDARWDFYKYNNIIWEWRPW